MTSKSPVPDYDLDERMELTSADQVRAIGHPLRTTILGLLHERAATVTEMAEAVGRPKSTVAHHINVLQRAGLVQVVRTRRVRAIEERYYGRTARIFYVGVGKRSGDGPCRSISTTSMLPRANRGPPPSRTELWSFIRHAHIPASERRVLVRGNGAGPGVERLPQAGGWDDGFVAGVYPIPDYPALPDPEEV